VSALWEKDKDTISIVIIDHRPPNPGYSYPIGMPGDYGLFAANPLGQKYLAKAERSLNFS